MLISKTQPNISLSHSSMDFNLSQWRNDPEEDDHQQTHNSSSSSSSSSSSLLPLFSVSEPFNNLSPFSSDSAYASKFPRIGSYFSLQQWQELELQALIFRHMIAGATVPHELLHLVKKSLITSPYHQFYPQYHSPCYWGKGAMDPEPGRCRRTDGKKWRCSKDVVAGQKYCERHVHRGKNRSRKPVEIPTPYGGNRGGGGALKTNNSVTTQGAAGGGDTPHFTLSMPSRSMDALQPNQRHSNFEIETKDKHHGQTLQRFFDDWPQNHASENSANSTNLSISMAENPPSDFSLTLGTGSENEPITEVVNGERGKPRLNWGMSTWETNHVGSMGGPLAEALRSSSMSSSSPTSVLHRLARSLRS